MYNTLDKQNGSGISRQHDAGSLRSDTVHDRHVRIDDSVGAEGAGLQQSICKGQLLENEGRCGELL
jgi:hypothetical protein